MPGDWFTDLMAGIGGGLTGAGQMLQLHNQNEHDTELEQQKIDAQAKLQDTLNALNERIAQLQSTTQKDVANIRETGETGRTGMNNQTQRDVAAGQSETSRAIAEMGDATNRFIAQGGWKNNLDTTRAQGDNSRAVANISAGASRYGADRSLEGNKYAVDTADKRWNTEFPVNTALAGYKIQSEAQRPVTGFYPGQSAINPNVPGFDKFAEGFAPTYRGMLGQPEPPPVNGRPAPLVAPPAAPARPGAATEPNLDALNQTLAALTAKPNKTPADYERMKELIAQGAGR